MQTRTEIALIGMAGIYPGAPTVGQLWRNILSKIEAVTDAPESWNAKEYHDAKADGTVNTKTYCQRGGFIEQYAQFNPLDFGVMPNSIDGSDPGHFMALRVARESLADAGYLNRPFNRERTAVIVGHGSYPHRGMMSSGAYAAVDGFFKFLREAVPGLSDDVVETLTARLKSRLPPFTPDTCPGLISNLLAGRIANRLDLMGPNYMVDAACASSLIALDSGVRELQSGRCDMVLVGGAQDNTPAGVFIVFSMLGALSRRGHLRPFGKNADGTLLGEGVGFAVIKRLADAERDGDRIYAVVKGVGLSSDGQGQAFLVPRLEGEVAAMRRAYENAGVGPDTVGLIEAHGTATPVGDRTEVRAMAEVFGARDGHLPRCAVGSVKSMISHTIPASGMASLFKTALALYHKVLPPTLCEEPNPDLGIERTAVYINTETRPWISGRAHPRRAGVSAFGFGGVNSHCVLEEYAGAPDGAPTLARDWDSELVVIQGAFRAAVLERAGKVRAFLEKNPDAALRDVAFTLNVPMLEAEPVRLAIVAESRDDLAAKLDAAARALSDPACDRLQIRSGIYYFDKPLAREGRLAFLAPGEGAQYAGMLSDLCIHFEEVRRWFDRADRAFIATGREPLPSQVAFPPTHLTADERRRLDDALWSMEYALPLITTADGAIYHLMVLLGVKPQAMAGHSTAQDLAIEAAAGVDRTAPENVMYKPVVEDRVIEKWVHELVPEARLMSVGASDPTRVAALAAESAGALYVAMDNCPNQVVLCGGAEAIEKARATLEAEGALCVFLPFDRGYHTPMYRPVCERLEQTTSSCEDRIPKIPVYCTTTGMRLPETAPEIRRIMIDQWAEPIRFRETIERMYADGIRLFLEIGPRGNLCGFVDDTLGGREHAAIPCNLPNRSGLLQLHHALAMLCAHGVPASLEYLYNRRNPVRLRIDDASASAQAKPAQGPARGVKLKMDIPIVHFDDQERRMMREGLIAALGVKESPSVQSSTLAEAFPMADPSDSPGADSPVLQTHVLTMNRILATHEQVLAAVLTCRDGNGPATAADREGRDSI